MSRRLRWVVLCGSTFAAWFVIGYGVTVAVTR